MLMALVACQKTDPIIAVQGIDLATDATVVFGPGSLEELEFVVTPADADFNFDVSSPDCQIRLGVKGSPATVVPQNYALESVTLVSEKEGRYKAMIRDKGASSSYDESSLLRVTAANDAGELYTVTSDYFRVYVQKAPIFRTVQFLQENNKTALDSDHIVNVSTGNAILTSPKITSPHLVATFDSRGAKVYVDKLPFAGKTFELGREMNIDPVSAALNGGEDYRLLFTIPIGKHEKFRHDFQTFDIIGHLAKPEVGAAVVTPDGVELPIKAQGWKNE